MNARILELLKSPELLQKEDLKTLREEISVRPYQQSLRALHLYGTHLFSPENYPSELSTTAAFTTDKKILYQFINRNSAEHKTEEIPAETVEETEPEKQTSFEDHRAATFTEHYVPKEETAAPVFVNGERNRILFEGEEDFMERDTEKIDLEQTLESGTIVTENIEKKVFADEINEPKPVEAVEEIQTESQVVAQESSELESEEVSEETVEVPLKEEVFEEISQEKQEDNSALAFHGIEDFMPNVTISQPEIKENYSAPKPQLNRHEEEMKRLIAEVEAKMKKNKTEKIQSEPEEEFVGNTDLDFSENQPKIENKEEIQEEKIVEVESVKENKSEEKVEAPKEIWKPLSFEGNKPDAMIEQKSEVVVQKEISTKEEPVKKDENEKDVESVAGGKISEVQEETSREQKSNVPVFINTWQNWLKIDRQEKVKEENISVSKEEEKSKVIDKFIETEPKISKLKEESSFVVKEKTDDISHLMTETLAKIYTEQRLYSKAIKAYQILSEKHPEKSSLFAERIAEIKEMRQTK